MKGGDSFFKGIAQYYAKLQIQKILTNIFCYKDTRNGKTISEKILPFSITSLIKKNF